MRLLAIDTTGGQCSAALRMPGAADLILSETMTRGHAERLAPMVESLLADASLAPRDLDRIGVTIGPGSFAGVRVGVAFARGLSLAIGAPAVGISTLAVWAHTGRIPGHGDVWAVHDARRGELVLQRFSKDGPAGDPQLMSVEDAAARLSSWSLDPEAPPMRGMILRGSGAALVSAAMAHALGRQGDPPDPHPSALDLTILLDLCQQAPNPDGPPSPFYARPPDAKRPGGVAL